MRHQSIIVRAAWDDEARVRVATSADIGGLAVEAESFEAVAIKVLDAIRDLAVLNGIDTDLAELPVHILGEHVARVRVAA